MGQLTNSLKSKAIAFENLKRSAPPIIGNMAQNFFRKSFEDGGFTDNKFEKWQEPQRRLPGTLAYKYAGSKQRSAILVKTSRLRNNVGRSLKIATWESIEFSVPLPYAAIHNYGLAMKNGKKMPQRKFMGHSQTLLKKIDDYMKSKMVTLK